MDFSTAHPCFSVCPRIYRHLYHTQSIPLDVPKLLRASPPRTPAVCVFGLLGSGGCGHDLRGRALGDGGTRRLLHVAWGVHGRLPALQDRGRGRCYVPACRGCGKNYSDVRCCKNYSAVRCCKNYSAVRCCKNCCRCFVVVLLFILVLRAVLSFPKFLDVIPKNMPFLWMTWLAR